MVECWFTGWGWRAWRVLLCLWGWMGWAGELMPALPMAWLGWLLRVELGVWGAVGVTAWPLEWLRAGLPAA